MQCLPQGLGCAMSDPSHLRPDCDVAGEDQLAVPLLIRKGELSDEHSPNKKYIVDVRDL